MMMRHASGLARHSSLAAFPALCHRATQAVHHFSAIPASSARVSLQRGRCRELLRVHASADEGEDPIEGLVNSKVFQSEVVMQEFASIVKSMMELSRMSHRFPNFDLAGKRMYLDQMEANCGRYEVFIKRLELSQDLAAREYLRATNAQMLEAGFTLPSMFAGLKNSMIGYREMVEAEEQASVDPGTYANFLQGFKSSWSASPLGRFDMDYLTNVTDPQIMMRAQKDPQFWVAIKELSESADPSVMTKWMDNPNIGPLVAEMWKGMQRQQQQKESGGAS